MGVVNNVESPKLCFQTLIFLNPESITYLTPETVMDVSAIFVAKITFLLPLGNFSNILDCWPGDKAAYKGKGTINGASLGS